MPSPNPENSATPSLAPPLAVAHRFWIYSAYLLLILLLFHRLFLGEVFSSGASMLTLEPFRIGEERDLFPYINDSLGDQWRQFNVFEKMQRQAFQEWKFPLWNPSIFCGHPIHANGQSAFLFPFHLPYYFVDANLARGPLAILRMWICAIAMFHFARRLGMSATAAFLAGCIWTFGSFNIRHVGLNYITNVTFWMPVLLLALDRYLALPSIRRWAIFSLSIAVMQLAGHPETQFLAGLTCGMYAVARTMSLGGAIGATITRCFGVFFSMSFGTAMAAAALLPFVLQMMNSYEWREGPYGQLPGFPWEAMKQFLLPDIFGRPRAGFAYTGPATYHEPSLWIGIVPLLLVIGTHGFNLLDTLKRGDTEQQLPKSPNSVSRVPSGMIWFWAILALISVVATFDSGPLRELAAHSPVLGKSQLSRLCLIYQFAMALLAGIAMDRLQLLSSLRWTCVIVGLLLVLASAGILLAGATKLPAIDWNEPWRILWHHPAIRNWGNIAIASFGVLTLIVFRPFRPNVLCAFVAAELLWSAWDLNPTCPRALLDPPTPPQLAAFIERAGHQRIAATNFVLAPNLATQYGFRDVRGYDFPTPRRWVTVMKWLRLPIGLSTLEGKSLLISNPSQHLLEFLDASATRFLYTDQREANLAEVYQGNSRDKPWQIVARFPNRFDVVYENSNANPRAWMARSYKLVWSTELTEQSLSHTGLFAPFRRDPKFSVAETKRTSAIDKSSNQDSGDVTFERDAAEEVILRVESTTGGLVVLADRMDDGWNAEIDGESVEGMWTDYLFRGVVVPKGSHTVRWHYVCPGLRTGIWISIASTALLLFCVAVGGRRRWIGVR